jgi:hypothetical protein
MHDKNMEPTTKKSHGALIGSIIIVVILIIGGMYVFNMTKKNYQAQLDRQELQNTQAQDQVVQSLSNVSTSNDIDSLDKDIQSTDLTSLVDESIANQ